MDRLRWGALFLALGGGALSGCTPYSKSIIQGQENSLVDSVELQKKRALYYGPDESYFSGPNEAATVTLRGRIVGSNQQPLQNFSFEIGSGFPHSGVSHTVTTDGDGAFSTSVALSAESSWGSKLNAVEVSIAFGDQRAWERFKDDGGPITIPSPHRVLLQLVQERKVLKVKRTDFRPKLRVDPAEGSPDEIIEETGDATTAGSVIVLEQKPFKSPKNAALAAREQKRAEQARLNEARALEERVKAKIADLEKRWPDAKAMRKVTGQQFAHSILTTTLNTLNQRVFENVSVNDKVLQLYIPATVANASISANMRNFADFAEMFAVWCQCDGTTEVHVDTSYLGGQDNVPLRFKVDPDSGRAKVSY